MNASEIMQQFEIAVAAQNGAEMERISMLVMDGSAELQEAFFELCSKPA